MLKRLYANNYRCLVNFEINFDQLTLLMGPNGGGKSTLFDLLFAIQRLLVDGARVGEVFVAKDLTAWVTQTDQAFELDVQSEFGLFSYRLSVTYTPDKKKPLVEHERLSHDGKPLFEFNQGEVQLYHDDYTAGSKYHLDWTMSALATIVPRSDNRKLGWFKEWIGKLVIISLQPKFMVSESKEESNQLDRYAINFASWYRFISQEHQDKLIKIIERLRVIIPGFQAFKLEQAGRDRILKVGFGGDDDAAPVYFNFEQLSDGQRVMIVLYTLLLGLEDLGRNLFIDEPENYVALPEIQPWLLDLDNACGDGFPQAVLISHHPELIDYLGPESGQWIERDPLGPARLKNLPDKVNQGLKLSELIARGWTE